MVSDCEYITLDRNFCGIKRMWSVGLKTQERYMQTISALRRCVLVFCAAVCLSLLVGCAATTAKRPIDSGIAVIADVPFVAQRPDWCGPASLAMIFNFYGENISQDEIAREIFSPELKGTLSLEMVLYAFKKDFEAEAYQGGFADLRAKLKAGFPLIVSHKAQNEDKKVHYFVVFGFDDSKEVFYVHSDTKKDQVIGYRVFLKHWALAENLTFFIHPKNSN